LNIDYGLWTTGFFLFFFASSVYACFWISGGV